jgi:NhaA family Na+:H+ antiporter
VAALAGIGFTVSLFITSLAFERPELQVEAKVGILVASLLAGLLGALMLARFQRR